MKFSQMPLFKRAPLNSGDPCGPNLATTRSDSPQSNVSNQNIEQESSPDDHVALPLTSQEALVKLRQDIDQEINSMKQEFSKRGLWSWLIESISFKSELSKMRWPSVLFMVLHVTAHFIVSFILQVDNLATNWVGFQGFLLLLLLIFNLIVNLWDTQLRFKELLMKSEQISDLIRRCSEDKHLINKWRQHSWKSVNASTLFAPKSPCMHQTLTYRDNSCLNLPDFLLVSGDIIHLYPGERAPGDCISLKLANDKLSRSDGKTKKYKESKRISLNEGDVYHYSNGDDDEFIKSDEAELQPTNGLQKVKYISIKERQQQQRFNQHAKLKRAHHGLDFQLLSTPYIKSLKISLQRSHKRPVNSIEKECFIVSRKYFETYVIPLVFVLSTIVTAIHYAYLDLTDEEQKIKTISIAYLLMRPSLTIMPFLPWMFPCFWMIVNAYGSARLLCCAEAQRKRLTTSSTTASDSSKRQSGIDQMGLLSDGESPNHHWNQVPPPPHSSATGAAFSGQAAAAAAASGRASNRTQHHGIASNQQENLLATPTAAGSSDQNKHDENDLHDLQNKIKFSRILKMTFSLIGGKSGHIWRSSSLLQVLGCLTSLCCIDKVGILSWSNPTPEKVFILTKNNNITNHHQHHQDHNQRQQQQQDKQSLNEFGTGSGESSPIMQPLISNNSKDKTTTTPSVNDANLECCSLLAQSATIDSRDLETINDNGQELKHNNDDNSVVKHHNSFAAVAAAVAAATTMQLNSSKVEVLDVSQTFNFYRGFGEPLSIEQASKLQFDDPNWTNYINNLKPLGLAILLNNCCEQSFGDYFRFYKHISYESILRCEITPIVKRRCICALSELIGFSKNIVKSYNFNNQIGCYKLIDCSNQLIKQKGKLNVPSPPPPQSSSPSEQTSTSTSATATTTTRLKLPFPNIIFNIHQNSSTGSYQSFSQGTADIVLDSCVEYWDGKELMPLDEGSRKKIMDFYHRTSLTSYCSAFSYSPLLKNHNLNDHYIELPSENSKMLKKLESEREEDYLHKQIITLPYKMRSNNFNQNYNDNKRNVKSLFEHGSQSAISNQDLSSFTSNSPVLLSNQSLYETAAASTTTTKLQLPQINITMSSGFNGQERDIFHQVPRRHLSVDELPALNDSLTVKKYNFLQENYSTKLNSDKKINSNVKRLTEAMDELNDQVFVGMVAMQYQCCPDFVALVEQLEHACIRFVHFSKENELRSRVFSEKMGLESGWNCHISLQSDKELKVSCTTATSTTNQPSKLSNICTNNTFKPSERVSNILVGMQQNVNKQNSSSLEAPNCDDDQTAVELSATTSRRSSLSTSDQATLNSWRSLPSLVMRIISKVSYAKQQQTNDQTAKLCLDETGASSKLIKISHQTQMTRESDDGIELMEGVNGNNEIGGDNDDNDQSEKAGFQSLAFDMSNRAKLPKGIENIRPHLETIDNIPLQVSLFTDCTPALTKEMIEIMQDYGEIVCVIGSASSCLNTSIFLQANASIAIEPLAPQTCTQNGLRRSSGGRGRSEKQLNENLNIDKKKRDLKSHQRRKRRQKRRRRRRLRRLDRRQQEQFRARHHIEVTDHSSAIDNSPTVATTTTATTAAAAAAQLTTSEAPKQLLHNRRDRLGMGPQQVFKAKVEVVKKQLHHRHHHSRRRRRRNHDYHRPSYSDESFFINEKGTIYEASTTSIATSSSSPTTTSSSTPSSLSSSSSTSSSSSSSYSTSRASSISSSSSSSRAQSAIGSKSSQFDTDHRSDSDLEQEDFDKIFDESNNNNQIINIGGQQKQQQSYSKLALELPEPSSLASKLVSMPCCYSYNRKEPVYLYSLIMEARHFTFKMKNTFVCMMCFALSISSAQFLASILFLPPMLSSGLTIWLTVAVVPLMSFSLMYTKMDSQVMKMAVGKNLQLKPENITFFVICYLIKFIPSIIVVVLSFGLIIAHSCKLTGFGSSSLGPCWMFTYVKHGNSSSSSSSSSLSSLSSTSSSSSSSTSSSFANSQQQTVDDLSSVDEDLLWSSHLLTAQVCAAFLMVVYFVVISSGFVHRSHLMWQRSPIKNRLWVVISLTLIIVQVFYNQLVLQVNLNSSKIPYEFLASLPLHIWLISFSWPIIVIGINLLVKRAEIKATIRQQRRARFDFNTKLGMNSPF